MPQYFQRANYIEGGVAPRDAPSIAIPTQNPALQAKESLYKTIDQRVAEAAAIFNKQAAMKAKVVGEAAGASHATQELTLDVIEAAASANEPITITGDPTGNELQRAAYKGSMAVLASNYDAAMRGEITNALIEATQNPNSNPSDLQETVSNIVDGYVGALTTISPVTASKIGKSGAIYAQATVKSFSMGWMTRDIKKRLNDAKANAGNILQNLSTIVGNHERGLLAPVIEGEWRKARDGLLNGGASDSHIQSFRKTWEKKVLTSKLGAVEDWIANKYPGQVQVAQTALKKFMRGEAGHGIPERVQEIVKSIAPENQKDLRKHLSTLLANQEQLADVIDDTNKKINEGLTTGVIVDLTEAEDNGESVEDMQKIIDKLAKISTPLAAKLFQKLTRENQRGKTVISAPGDVDDLNSAKSVGALEVQEIYDAQLSGTDRASFLMDWRTQNIDGVKTQLDQLKARMKPTDPARISTSIVSRAKRRSDAIHSIIVREFYAKVGALQKQNMEHTKKQEYNKVKDIDFPGIMEKIEKKVFIDVYTNMEASQKSTLESDIEEWRGTISDDLKPEEQNIEDLFDMTRALSRTNKYGDRVRKAAKRFMGRIKTLKELQRKIEVLGRQ